LAYVVAAGLIVYFVQRTVRMHRELEHRAELLRQSSARREKLASLATLAAGAAHELATPLSTIALASRELERRLELDGTPASSVGDARLIRQEVERCRNILAQMAADAGTSAAEQIEQMPVELIVERSLAQVSERQRVRVTLDSALRGRFVKAPPRALAQSLQALLKNALEASAAGEVALQAGALDGYVRIQIVDRGPGMAPETLARAGEPFFSTKQPGQGMGLGLFLSRSVIEQLGGRLELASEIGSGTRATVALPLG
jgi:two-component system sensor histidine kinase RegB